MPPHLRGDHVKAGNRGAYPANGAQRLRVTSACAEQMVEHDPDWCEIVETPTA